MDLIFRILTFIYSFISFFERKIFIKNIKGEDLVLDVGSGDKPFWRADVIVDKYLDDDQQRHSGSIIYDNRKIFVNADVEKLPFKDKVFDFVFCSHLLEHVENPEKAIGELTRVAKSGYIEVPYAILDLFEPFPPHLWFCNYRDGILTFVQKEKEQNYLLEITERFGKFFFPMPMFQYLIARFQNQIFINIYWKKDLKYKVIRATKKPYVYKYKNDVGQGKNLSTKLSFIFYKVCYLIVTLLLYKQKKVDFDNILLKPST